MESGSRKDRQFRIGIDVGGTFTHAVALEASTLELAAKVKVPTTHRAEEGVARGIIAALHAVLEEGKIDPSQVAFIAHSTTQATNALLEGDVAPVGILGMGLGFNSWLAKVSTDIKPIELARGRYLETFHEYLDTRAGLSESRIKQALERLAGKGARAFAISQAFSVDDQSCENLALTVARGMGFPATSGSEVSKLYGLKVRTRTAVINAAMLPKMIETANMTEQSVRDAGITAPIMIMRSDGGVMDIEAMRQRPILTRLSGPAAGVAGAMMYLRISDGIFLEVGGTSTDISVIRNGKALVKDAEIGGHRLYLRSLDVNTLGVAGGSMIRIDDRRVIDLGPRSAHIAGLGYAAFADSLDKPSVKLISPMTGDPKDYVALVDDGRELTLTTTCAANLLGLVPEGDCARGLKKSVESGFKALAEKLADSSEAVATQVMDKAYEKCLPAIKKFAADYKLDLESTTLVGGGGGAAAIVPYLAQKLHAEHALAANADVISAIGVALALVRETVERQIPQPKQEDLLRIREEAVTAVARMGAAADSIEVHMEIDPRTGIIRATAYGATGLTETRQEPAAITDDDRVAIAAASLKCQPEAVSLLARTEHFRVFGAHLVDRRLFGLLSSQHTPIRVVDHRGVIRVKMANAACRTSSPAEVEAVIADLCESHAVYGDAGKVIPDFMLLVGPKVVDLSGLLDAWQVQTLARSELGGSSPQSELIVLACLPR